MCRFPRAAVLLATVVIYVIFLCIYFKSDAKTAGSKNPVQAYYAKQKSARLQYLNTLSGRQWSTLYIVLVPEEIQTFNNYSCRIYGYSKRVIAEDLKARYNEINGKFTALQIAPITHKDKDSYALNDLVKINKDKTVEFLKMDIEQSEHDTLLPFLEEYQVCQIFVEIHGEAQKHTSLLQQIASLDYALFSYEPNPYCKHCCEYSFIHLDCMQRYGATVSNLYLKDVVPALN